MANMANVANANAIAGSTNMLALVDVQIAAFALAMAQADTQMTDQKGQAATQNADEIADHADQWQNAAQQQNGMQFNPQPLRPAPVVNSWWSTPAWYKPWTYWGEWSWRGLGQNYIEGAQILMFAEGAAVDLRWGGLRWAERGLFWGGVVTLTGGLGVRAAQAAVAAKSAAETTLAANQVSSLVGLMITGQQQAVMRMLLAVAKESPASARSIGLMAAAIFSNPRALQELAQRFGTTTGVITNAVTQIANNVSTIIQTASRLP